MYLINKYLRIPVSLDYQGATITIHSKLYEIPAFMKGGSVLGNCIGVMCIYIYDICICIGYVYFN